jgi:2-amino-4-hydroxy-6-hydroxymethyldihydropteridine diphosphokinase
MSHLSQGSMTSNFCANAGCTFIALGANAVGAWGEPAETLMRALRELKASHIEISAASSIYQTAPIGGGRQLSYLNAVIATRSSNTPTQLLRLCKRLEKAAGRRLGRHWGPRPLDLDILDARGLVLGWPCTRRSTGRLVVPHPEMAGRAFVLVPLSEIAPHWHHPALGQTVSQLLSRLQVQRRNVRSVLDFPDLT